MSRVNDAQPPRSGIGISRETAAGGGYRSAGRERVTQTRTAAESIEDSVEKGTQPHRLAGLRGHDVRDERQKSAHHTAQLTPRVTLYIEPVLDGVSRLVIELPRRLACTCAHP